METNKKVILELYMDVWYCYEYDNGSMADPLFTSTSQKLATDEAESEGYEVVQVIDMSYLDEEGNEIPLYLQNDKTKVDSNDFLIAENAALKESNEVLLDALKEIRNNIRFDIAMPQYTTDARLTDIIFRAENKILKKA